MGGILRPDLGKLVYLLVGAFLLPKIIRKVRP
jgi:hypothetical protein